MREQAIAGDRWQCTETTAANLDWLGMSHGGSFVLATSQPTAESCQSKPNSPASSDESSRYFPADLSFLCQTGVQRVPSTDTQTWWIWQDGTAARRRRSQLWRWISSTCYPPKNMCSFQTNTQKCAGTSFTVCNMVLLFLCKMIFLTSVWKAINLKIETSSFK